MGPIIPVVVRSGFSGHQILNTEVKQSQKYKSAKEKGK